MKVLYVDDEELNLELFGIIFHDDFEVITASSATEGLKCLSDNSDIKIVLSDLKMPGMNGLEFIKYAKQLYKDVHFFLLTGFGVTDAIRKAINEKLITRHLSKPLDEQEIRDALGKVL